ncbi:putative protein with domain of unknown function (DUF1708) [Lyophyllum shimeji]|uniref:Meiotically up-regulated protein Msb1/Mug8 domain-containing protein n=1 Tax=Lyophyllum shimeji TaxID=47721 RepID=A0A9P3PWJ3_LYOSH|nr:putative protein with domain of unknown function (DUF1708) [Lyophyllum shimeji]
MPSFLSKVFGRKKDDKESPRSPGQQSDSELLDGKFESVSPSATKFPEVVNEKVQGKEKDTGFTLFKSKSRPSSPEDTEKRQDVPHLSLNLPGLKDESASRALGVVFEADPEAQILLSDAAIGGRRLNPLETLILVRACSQAITARGLETLGIMHPHWYSASPEVQRKLISLFIQSLAPKTPITTLAPTSSAFVAAFESEISSTRSPHDVAAVLRWGLRHLQLEGNSFGKEESWYKTFFDAEGSSNYPANGFSTILGPTLPASHLELLTATLEIFSSLAAHAEANGISGSKLSKFFGLWLLTVQRTHEDDDWSTFYDRWERTGRMLEHLFLSRIRDEAAGSRMPTRLLELVKHYPYNKISSPEADLLPRPRFSTRRYDALFVRIETELAAAAERPTHHPLRLISDAFKAEIGADAGEYAALWETIRKAGTDDSNRSPGVYPGLSCIFADETLRFFALIPIDKEAKEPTSPAFNLIMPSSHRKSFSLDGLDKTAVSTTLATIGNGISKHTKPATDPTPTSAIGTDWTTFSTSGFFEDGTERTPLASTLMDKDMDMEVTVPKAPRPKPIVASLISGRKSLDTPRPAIKAEQRKPEDSPSKEPVKTVSRSTHVALIQLDEAFIDFWSDALLDPISSTWPAFIICKLKSTLTGMEVEGKRLEWLVIEQSFKRPPPPTPVSPETSTETSPDSARRARPSSPKSFVSDITLSSTLKRFSFFSSGRASMSSDRETKSKRKAGQGARVGEMGEILAEEDEGKENGKEQKERRTKGKVDLGTVRVRIPSPKSRKSTDVPRKSVDAPKKSFEEAASKSNGLAAAGLAAGATAVAAAVSSDAAETEEPASAAPAANGTAVENVTPAPSETHVAAEATPAEPETAAPAAPASHGSAKAVDTGLPAAESAQPIDKPQEPAQTHEIGTRGAAEHETAAEPEVHAEAVEPSPAPVAVPELAAEQESAPAAEPALQQAVDAEAPAESASTDVEEGLAAVEPSAEEVTAPAPVAEAAPEAVSTPSVPVETAVEPAPAAAAEPEVEIEAASPAVEEESTPAAAVEPEVVEVEAQPEAPAEDVAEPAPAAVVEPEVIAQEAPAEPVDPTPAAPETADAQVAPEAPVEDLAEPTPAAAVEPEVAPALVEETPEEPVEPTPAGLETPEVQADEPVSVAAEEEAAVAQPAPEVVAEEPEAEPEVPVVDEALEPALAAPVEPEVSNDTVEEPVAEVQASEPADAAEETPAAEVEVVEAGPASEISVEETAAQEPEASAAEPEVVEPEAPQAPAEEDHATPSALEVDEPAESEATPAAPEEPVDGQPSAEVPPAAEPPAAVEESAAEVVLEDDAAQTPAQVEEASVLEATSVVPEPEAAPEPAVEEEPAAAEEVAVIDKPAVEEPAAEAPAVEGPETEVAAELVEEDSADQGTPAVEIEPTVPAVEEAAPAAEEVAPVVEEEPGPVTEEAASSVEEAAPVVEENVGLAEEAAPAMEEEPVADEVPASTEQTSAGTETPTAGEAIASTADEAETMSPVAEELKEEDVEKTSVQNKSMTKLPPCSQLLPMRLRYTPQVELNPVYGTQH